MLTAQKDEQAALEKKRRGSRLTWFPEEEIQVMGLHRCQHRWPGDPITELESSWKNPLVMVSLVGMEIVHARTAGLGTLNPAAAKQRDKTQ